MFVVNEKKVIAVINHTHTIIRPIVLAFLLIGMEITDIREKIANVKFHCLYRKQHIRIIYNVHVHIE